MASRGSSSVGCRNPDFTQVDLRPRLRPIASRSPRIQKNPVRNRVDSRVDPDSPPKSRVVNEHASSKLNHDASLVVSYLGLQTPGLPKNGGCLLLPVLYINPACPRYVTAHALLCCVGVTCLILRPIPEYMKVYAPWACVCLAEFGDMCKGVMSDNSPSHVRGFPPPPRNRRG